MSPIAEREIRTRDFARRLRIHTLHMVHRANSSHVGSCFSMADILSVLYADILCLDPQNPKMPSRDRFLLSKGHAAAGIYAALALRGFIAEDDLASYGVDGSPYMAHISHKVSGVEFSTGALGHGLPFAVGKALAAQKSAQHWRTFAVLGDGEMDEGSNWEALMFAAHHKLSNLVAIIDCNNLQSLTTVEATLNIEPLADKLRAFGAVPREVDGHDHAALLRAFDALPFQPGKPSVVIARTVKGKGVSYMENRVEWHYRAPNRELLEQALREISQNSP